MILLRPCIPVFMWDTGTTSIIVRRLPLCRIPHVVTHYYAASHWVAWSVGLSVALSVCHTSEPCKTAETIKLPFAFRTRVGPMNHVLNEVQMPTWGGAILRENRQTIVKYRDTTRSSVQRRLNQSRCRLGCGLVWAESIMCYMGGPDPPWEGAILVDKGAHCKV